MTKHVEEHTLTTKYFKGEDSEEYVKVVWSATSLIEAEILLFTVPAHYYDVPGIREIFDTAAKNTVRTLVSSIVGGDVKIEKVEYNSGVKH